MFGVLKYPEITIHHTLNLIMKGIVVERNQENLKINFL